MHPANDSPLPGNVQTLICDAIESVVTLEILLLLYRQPQREWWCEEVASELRIAANGSLEPLKRLVKGGLVCAVGQRMRCFRYYPATMDLNAAVAELARTYALRPLTVVSFIHSRPAPTLRRFANAFRVRSDGHD